MKNSRNYFTTGEFARICGVKKQTLFHYDDIGIFRPAITGENGYRYYSYTQIETFAVLMALRDLNVPLKEIKEHMDHRSPQALIQLLEERREEVDEMIRKLQWSKKFINTKIELTREGLHAPLGEIVFEKVCSFVKKNRLRQYGIQYVEVNLSVLQCADERLSEKFINIMEKYKVSPDMINLEITETASMRAKRILLDNMKNLMNYGVNFSLDDFGTGESNLNYIVDMPVSIVKFDKGMTDAYFRNGRASYVMDAAIRMIQGMHLKIVSEGVETEKQFEVMKDLGINYIQGYYFSKPLPELEFLQFIEEKNVNLR